MIIGRKKKKERKKSIRLLLRFKFLCAYVCLPCVCLCVFTLWVGVGEGGGGGGVERERDVRTEKKVCAKQNNQQIIQKRKTKSDQHIQIQTSQKLPSSNSQPRLGEEALGTGDHRGPVMLRGKLNACGYSTPTSTTPTPTPFLCSHAHVGWQLKLVGRKRLILPTETRERESNIST